MDYEALLEQVRTSEIEKFEVTSDEFGAFYEVWRDYPYQNAIRGIADRGGHVTYEQKLEEE
jgi:hypothetical protein